MNNPLINCSFDYEYYLAEAMPIAKKIKHDMVCKLHKRRVRLYLDYDNDGVNATITYCCCPEFANIVTNALKETELFNKVHIKD